MAEDVARLFQEHFQVIYEQGGRWEARAVEIGKHLLKGSAEGKTIRNLACALVEQAKDWADVERRLNAIFDPLQKGQGGANYWFYGNKHLKKCLAKTYIRLLGTLGLPAGKELERLSSRLSVIFGINIKKEVAPAQFVEEEVPHEEPVSVEKGFWPFKRKVIEKQIVIKKVRKKARSARKATKTAEELIKELAQFV
ncbi:hypothetical protein GF343_02035 [Candidatus Woesearchaeota archaeon]|nr:hypothetical protein [Candidatus Woesearchaeota archaeon]